MGPAYRSRFGSRAFLRSAIVLRGLGYGRRRLRPVGVRMLTRRSPLSSLPACTDFDIEKMRPAWRDEVYQNWRAGKASRPPATACWWKLRASSVPCAARSRCSRRGLSGTPAPRRTTVSNCASASISATSSWRTTTFTATASTSSHGSKLWPTLAKNFGFVTWTGEIQPAADDPRYFMIAAARSGIRLSPRRHSGLGPAPPRVTDCHLSVTFLVYAKRSAIKQRREEYGPPRLEKGSCPRGTPARHDRGPVGRSS